MLSALRASAIRKTLRRAFSGIWELLLASKRGMSKASVSGKFHDQMRRRTDDFLIMLELLHSKTLHIIPPWSRHLVTGHACPRPPHPACNMQTRSGEAPELAARNAPRAGASPLGHTARGPRTGILQAARIREIPQDPAKSPGEPARNTYVIPRRQVDDKKKRRYPVGGRQRFSR